MNVWQLVVREVAHRRLGFALALLSVTAGVGSLVSALASRQAHDRRTREMLARKEDDLRHRIGKMTDDTRRAMLHLGFNIAILPKDQNLADWCATRAQNNCQGGRPIRTSAGQRVLYRFNEISNCTTRLGRRRPRHTQCIRSRGGSLRVRPGLRARTRPRWPS